MMASAELAGLLHVGLRHIINRDGFSSTLSNLNLDYPFCALNDIADFLSSIASELPALDTHQDSVLSANK